VTYVREKSDEWYEDVRSLCSIQPMSPSLAIICLPGASHVDRLSTRNGEINEDLAFSDDPIAMAARIKGIVCAILTDILAGLGLCEELLGKVEEAGKIDSIRLKLQKVSEF
jgi:hypothetical protein